MRNIKIVFVRYYSSLQRKQYIMPNAMVMQSVPCAHWGCAVNHRCITLNAADKCMMATSGKSKVPTSGESYIKHIAFGILVSLCTDLNRYLKLHFVSVFLQTAIFYYYST